MRTVVLGNQRMLVNLDQHLFVRDIYYKRVGQENHVLGKPHRIGVWANNELSWLDEDDWKKTVHTDSTLASKATVRSEKRGTTITVQDVVLKDHNVLLRRFSANKPVRLFIYQYFYLYGDGIGDTAGYDPVRNAVFHYKRNRYFLIGALDGNQSTLADYTVGVPHDEQDAWRDAYDGHLSKNAIAQGNVDSCVAFDIPAEKTITYLLVAGKSFGEVQTLFEEMQRADRDALLEETLAEHRAYAQLPASFAKLKPSWQEVHQKSLLLVRAHTDSGGAIVAGADSDNMLFNKDTYCYAWGRDNALIVRAMNFAGRHELSRSYYRFMQGVIEPGGFYMHKHHPDGSLGSSWQAWVRDGKAYLPIQQDETALTLWSLLSYHETARDDFLNDKYTSWIAPMIDFLATYVRDDIALPKDCWDLWEERQGIHTWTVASVIAGLRAGAFFAKLHDDEKRLAVCNEMAQTFTDSMLEFLYSKQYKRFIRRLTPDLEPDYIVDAADMAAFVFGVLPPEHEAVRNTTKAIEEHLRTPTGGIARYQGDYFHRVTEEAPGNPWVKCTLWLAQWHASQGHWKEADAYIDWVVQHATPSKLLGEQMHPLTGEPLGVCPLTWSHATFIETMFFYVKCRGW